MHLKALFFFLFWIFVTLSGKKGGVSDPSVKNVTLFFNEGFPNKHICFDTSWSANKHNKNNRIVRIKSFFNIEKKWITVIEIAHVWVWTIADHVESSQITHTVLVSQSKTSISIKTFQPALNLHKTLRYTFKNLTFVISRILNLICR